MNVLNSLLNSNDDIAVTLAGTDVIIAALSGPVKSAGDGITVQNVFD